MEAISQESNGHNEHHQVRFAEDDFGKHDMEIVVKYKSEEDIDIHLGFLQINHKYEISVEIKDGLGCDVEADPLENLHVKLLTYVPTDLEHGHVLKLEFNAHKEKLIKEKLHLRSSDGSKSVLLVFNARVLGKGKGTPSLKNGIKCVLAQTEDDSDATDWQGFD